jgi:hypothetical protein
MNKNLYTNGFILIFKIHFHNIRATLRPWPHRQWQAVQRQSGEQLSVKKYFKHMNWYGAVHTAVERRQYGQPHTNSNV